MVGHGPSMVCPLGKKQSAVVTGGATEVGMVMVGHGPSMVCPLGKKQSAVVVPGGYVVGITGSTETDDVIDVKGPPGTWIGHGPPPITITVVPPGRMQVSRGGGGALVIPLLVSTIRDKREYLAAVMN